MLPLSVVAVAIVVPSVRIRSPPPAMLSAPPEPRIVVPPLSANAPTVSVNPARSSVPPLLSVSVAVLAICSLAAHWRVPPLTVTFPPTAFVAAGLFSSSSPASRTVSPV
jgi:hypothetical protein